MSLNAMASALDTPPRSFPSIDERHGLASSFAGGDADWDAAAGKANDELDDADDAYRDPSSGDEASCPNLDAGVTLGRYRILRPLARGGATDVFLAEVVESGRLVVLKCVRPDVPQRDSWLRAFERGSRVAEMLWHPNLVQVLDGGELEGWPYVAMEFVDGIDLGTFMRRARELGRRTPLDLVVHIALGVCAALHHAHDLRGPDGASLGIVHGDLAPRHVRLLWEGTVRLLDCGLSRLSAVNPKARPSDEDLPYRSPEQCANTPLDRRADLFSLGAVLYELTVGRPPFEGRTESELAASIRSGAPRPAHEIDPNYDPDLETIVMRALERSPEFRFQTAREMGTALGSLLEDRGLRSSPADLKEHLELLFADRIEARKRAQASGRTLAQFLAQDGEASNASSPLPSVDVTLDDKPHEDGAGEGSREDPPTVEIATDLRSYTPLEAESVPATHAPQEPRKPWQYRRVLGVVAAVLAVTAVAGVVRFGFSGTAHKRMVKVVPQPPSPARANAPAPVLQAVASSPTPPPLVVNAVAANPTPPPQQPSAVTSCIAAPALAPPMSLAAPLVVEKSPAPDSDDGLASTHGDSAELGKLRIRTSPVCQVVLDGRPRGKTPFSTHLPPGPHVVVLRNEALHVERTFPVTISPTRSVHLRLDLAAP